MNSLFKKAKEDAENKEKKKKVISSQKDAEAAVPKLSLTNLLEDTNNKKSKSKIVETKSVPRNQGNQGNQERLLKLSK